MRYSQSEWYLSLLKYDEICWLTSGQAAVFVYSSWDQWERWYSVDPNFTAVNKATLVTYSLQVLGNTVLASYKIWQIYDVAKGLPSVAPSVAGIAADEKMTNAVAMMHPNVIVNDPNPVAQLQAGSKAVNAAAEAQIGA